MFLLFSFLTPAAELTTGDDAYIEEDVENWVPDRWVRSTITVRRQCKKGECEALRPPFVEGQKLVYVYPHQQKNYVQLHQPVKSFFKQWAKSCYEKQTLEAWFHHFAVRDNTVTSFSGSLEMLEKPQVHNSWQKLLAEYDPKILIFLLQTPEKPFTAEKWKKLLTKIPTYLGCVLVAPPTQKNITGQSLYFKNLREAIAANNSSCQLVRADEEILSLAQDGRTRIFNLNGQLTVDGQAQWWKQTRFQLCEMEPMREVSGSKGSSWSRPSSGSQHFGDK